MKTFREIKRQARQTLHTRLSEPAVYLVDELGAPVPVTVRLHLTFDTLGQLLTVSSGFADRQELTPRIVFLGAQVTPVRNSYLITKDMGAYRVDNDVPPDDITITTEVNKLSDAQCVRFGWDPALPFMGFPTPVFAG